MYIPLILFAITIERKKRTPEQILADYRQQQAIKAWEEQKNLMMAKYPEYWVR
jgi:hypothetical protein